MRIVLILNLFASLASAAFGALALIRPEALSSSKAFANSDPFYARMYAARAIPFSLSVGILPFFQKRNATLAWFLLTASAIQGFDVAIAIARNQRGMAVGASVGATVHLACALAVA